MAADRKSVFLREIDALEHALAGAVSQHYLPLAEASGKIDAACSQSALQSKKIAPHPHAVCRGGHK